MTSLAAILAHAVVETARISIPTVLERASDHETFDRRLDSWSKKLLDEAHITLDVDGAGSVPDGEVVIMSNHASLYDIPVLFQSVPKRLRMVAKTELFRIPVWGRAMRASGFVELDRGNKERAMAALQLARKKMHEDRISIWIAPEGTRSKTGIMGPFKQGGFHLAIDAGLPILPVTIVGTHDVLAKGKSEIKTGVPIRVVMHAAIDALQWGHERRKELSAEVRRVIASALPEELRGEG